MKALYCICNSMWLILLSLLLSISISYAEGKKSVAVFQIENRFTKFKIRQEVLEDITDKVIAHLEKSPKYYVVEKSEIKKITREVKEQLENPLYEMKAADNFGRMIGADVILFLYVSDIEIEGKFEIFEGNEIIDITSGEIVVTVNGRFVDLRQGTVISNPREQGRCEVKGMIYEIKTSKTLDAKGISFESAVKKALNNAIEKLQF